MIITVNVDLEMTVCVEVDDDEEARTIALELVEAALEPLSVVNPIDHDSDAEWCEMDNCEMCAYVAEDQDE